MWYGLLNEIDDDFKVFSIIILVTRDTARSLIPFLFLINLPGYYFVQQMILEYTYHSHLTGCLKTTINDIQLHLFSPFYFGEKNYYTTESSNSVTVGIYAVALSIKPLKSHNIKISSSDSFYNIAYNYFESKNKTFLDKKKTINIDLKSEVFGYIKKTNIDHIYEFYGQISNRNDQINSLFGSKLIRFDITIGFQNSDIISLFLYTLDMTKLFMVI